MCSSDFLQMQETFAAFRRFQQPEQLAANQPTKTGVNMTSLGLYVSVTVPPLFLEEFCLSWRNRFSMLQDWGLTQINWKNTQILSSSEMSSLSKVNFHCKSFCPDVCFMGDFDWMLKDQNGIQASDSLLPKSWRETHQSALRIVLFLLRETGGIHKKPRKGD